MITPVVMAGGTGSRLWPLSRELYPKQFLRLNSDNSMLQETLLRLDGLNITSPLVICNETHRFLVAEQLRQIEKLANNIILEPVGKNTAPAIALAAFNAIKKNENPILLVLAADHIIEDNPAFHTAIEQAIPFAEQGKLVTFGIVPKSPETGYGYIRRGAELHQGVVTGFTVGAFVEKPDKITAQSYVDSKEYYWNSGMFLFRASNYLEQLSKFRPDIYSLCEKAIEGKNSDDQESFIRVNREYFEQCPDESVDYAVMEKTQDAVVIPMDAGWNDVGSWSALWEIDKKDISGNKTSGDVFTEQTTNCYINSEEGLIAAIGVDNLVIVNTKDAMLVIGKDKVQDVKKVVEYLKKMKRPEYREHRESYRPWGHVDKVVCETKYNINRLTVKPGGVLSLQMHHHRAEHWVVLAGTAKVTLDEKSFFLTENQSTIIPIGSTHMLENPGKIPLELLEIQSGDYLADDDVIRLKDHYNFGN